MIGCLCIHGFTGSPFEIEPLVSYLQERTDWEFSIPTLPGHGETLSLKGIRYKQWIEHAEKELQMLLEKCDEVYLIGFSMGGIIASYLAVHYPVTKLVLLSAAAYYVNPRQLAADIGLMVKDAVAGSLLENELFHRYKRKIISTPLSATIQFRRLVASIRPLLKQIQIPTFIAQGEEDGIVPLKSARYLYDKIGTNHKDIKYVSNSGHLICHCDKREQLFSDVFQFLKADEPAEVI
ncbi:carboxylesterase [Bacillus canaveralius]|uniref:Carboxylesterase n=1 Tax=Bacillus canaveralius TaxID=1403243 RepID=A0A2N5GS91_9BACI|nr:MULTISPECIES: alpha/beta fold hydrolase [Bacillus]PLR81139.1 carboxylesterase [Bacillus sp. V33-4]PLR86407.1 carboxylesterase [Bacillus canaveralius]PLR97785.1 carboxylesterase [Bacillus canaveralius]RSK57309.1 alpha/beta fold hydrolase [Bacillus canaveralius]